MKYTQNLKKGFLLLMTAFVCFGVLTSHAISGTVFFSRFGKNLINFVTHTHQKIEWYKEYRFLQCRIRSLFDQRLESSADISGYETSRLWHDLYKNKKQIKKAERFSFPSFHKRGYEHLQHLCFGKEGIKEKKFLLNSLKKQQEELNEKMSLVNERVAHHPHIQKIDDELEQIMQRVDRLNHFRST